MGLNIQKINAYTLRFFVNMARMAFRTARTMTPTSAKIASHMLAIPTAPSTRQMICVADSFDAMNTNRVYRNKLSKERIIEEIETNKGRQFDPEIAEVFLRILRENRLPTES